MTRVCIVLLAILLATGTAPAPMLRAAGPPATQTTTESQPSPNYDTNAERRLLEMANRERAKAGLPPLQVDDGLAKAARAHATAMASQRKLSHRLSGEPNLTQRLAAHTKTHLDRAGENVAFAGSVDQAQDSLMRSPPHRANLLNAGYNVAGFSVVRRGSLLYVAQDFGHSLPTYSVHDAEDIVAAGVNRMRAQTRLPALRRLDDTEDGSAACSTAEVNSLRPPSLRGRYILRYTNSQPQTLPASAAQAIGDRSLRSFAVGSCYAHTSSYPTGVYWVRLLFY